ncbi:glycosyltransferase [Bacteroides sp.]|uniref:glycosyltransferase n=1 Tax=Bacteroides sp. TaxID=29523 RepID=UPI003A93897B
MLIPIILLNYNSSKDCRKCVGFLKRQQGVELEIIIVDNCSQDDDREQIKLLCREYDCTFIPADKNRGYNAGNNIGLRYVATKNYKYALIANPDMEFPQTDYIAKMVDAMEKRPNVVACGSDIVSPEGIHQNPMERDGNWQSSVYWLFSMLKRKKSINNSKPVIGFCDSQYCYKISGCCLLVHTDYIRSINYFDENVFLYTEEAILAKQIERDNKQMYYLAEAQAIHRHIKNEKGDPIKHIRQWKRSRIYFIKHYSNDTHMGKQIAIIAMCLYVAVITVMLKLKKR